MSHEIADRNMLFGILALQMDFITSAQLIGAMQDWVLAKDKALGQILLKKGALAEDTYALLEALLKKHLAQHGGEVHKSLTAVGSAASIKKQLEAITDPDLQESLSHVTADFPAPSQSASTRGPAVGEATSAGVRFRILRPHARGGLGEVHVARDEELRREVALKQIQDRHADNRDSQARFLLEAEITGSLEHPGIVPVYGLGQYADGRPYYAMRFIRGDSLKDACDRFHKADVTGRDPGERSLELRALLGRLVDVCNAIAYAHSRGVLHRDLKPGNIMLGKYGETLVVDWGLAKTQESPPTSGAEPGEGTITPSSASLASHTLMGSAMGTPQFMSPEQAAGRLDLLGPPSDVYSLGATMYVLLTGRPPFQDKEVATVLTKVQHGEFPAPRQLKPEIPQPLEAICLKAMARRPSDRYASPRGLAEDIEHWLADEPVSAWIEPWTVKARRWLSRHRTLVTGAATAVLVATLGLALATILLTAANERERAARLEATEQRAVAERNHQLARKAVDRYHTEVSESVLLHEPGMQPLRKKLLEAARDYYEKFVSERGNDTRLKGELGLALFRLAQITGDIGSELKALDLHQAAQEIFAGLSVAQPQEQDWQSELAKCRHHLGRLYRLTNQPAKAEDAYVQGLAVWEPLVAAHPETNSYRAGLARSQLGLGNIYEVTRRLDKSRDIYLKALETRSKLAKDQPDIAEYRRDLAVNYTNLARVYSALGTKDEITEQAYSQALANQKTLVRDFPHISQYANDLARTYFNLGEFFFQSATRDKAEAPYQQAAAYWQDLIRAHPAVTDFHINLAEAYMALAKNVYAASRQADKADEYAQKALTIKTKLAENHKGIMSYQNDLARGYSWLGDIYRVIERSPQALAAYGQAGQILETLASSPPLVPQTQGDLARTYNNLGLLHADLREKDEAEKAYRQALAVWEKLVRAFPQGVEFAAGLCITQYNLGNLLRNNGNPRGGLEWYAQAIRTIDALDPDRRRQTAARAALSKAHWYQAEALSQVDRPADAVRAWKQALDTAAPAERPWIRLYRAVALAQSGEHAAATAEANWLAPAAKSATGEALYQVVCIYAHAMAAATRDMQLAPEARRELADQYAGRAFEMLATPRLAGYFQLPVNFDKLRNDAALAPLRMRAEFQGILKKLEQKLKSAS